MSEFTAFAASPIPAEPSEESVRLLKRVAHNRRVSERVRPSGLSLRLLRLTMGIATLAGPPKGATVRDMTYGKARGRLVVGPGADFDNGVLFWVHGGAFVSGSPKVEQGLAARLSELSGLPAFLPYYRLAPEHPFPAAADDVLDAYLALLHEGFAADKIRVVALSAGGALVVGLLGDLVRGGLPRPARVLLMSPMLDLSVESARACDVINPDPFISPEAIARTNQAYLAGASLSDPRLDLFGADMTGWPPILVQTGGLECIRGDAEKLGAAMRSAGARCEVQLWPGQIHGFHGLGLKRIPEAKAAVEYGGRFLAVD
jgi:epsilon-lactone hydrolase